MKEKSPRKNQEPNNHSNTQSSSLIYQTHFRFYLMIFHYVIFQKISIYAFYISIIEIILYLMEKIEADTYKITLTQKKKEDKDSHVSVFGFRELARDFQTIYDNFTLLSYFSPSCQITILDRFYSDIDSNVEVDKFVIGKSESSSVLALEDSDLEYYLFQRSRQKFPKTDLLLTMKLTIKYNIGRKATEISSDNPIQVCFLAQARNNRQYIFITIKDEGSWIEKNFSEKIKSFPVQRISQRLKLNDNELQYFYKEPLSKRNKKTEGVHFSIALQGGGVKGVAYLGAYKAIKKEEPEIPIKSIIGSSAGGMLGLAICCQMTEKQMISLVEQQLSHLTDDQRYPQEDQTEAYKILKEVKQFLTEYGILHQGVVDLVAAVLGDQEFNDAILNLMEAWNPEIKKLFAVGPNKNKFSVRGLLEGALMSGSSIKEFAKTCLKSLRCMDDATDFQSWEKAMQEDRKKMRAKAMTINTNLSDDEWSETLTFRELYEITDTELTCTSVDIMSNCLRFFNHKTTPNMPVCKAVQMTGSFPVAFESQQWKTKQWGKYYIHYDNIRRQVDLEGHKFTDGGLLANFPIKYLDNEYMRPMYFSHAKVDRKDDKENYTIIYGFGLNAMKPPPDLSKQIQKFKAGCMRALNNHLSFWDKIKIASQGVTQNVLNWNEMEIVMTDEKNPITKLKQIPVFQFGFQLLNTYIKTKDNLTEECFSHRLFVTEIGDQYQKMIESSWNLEELEKNVLVLKEKFEEYLEYVSERDGAKIFDEVLFNINFVQKILENDLPYSENTLSKANLLMKSALTNISFTQLLLARRPDHKNYEITGPQLRDYFHEDMQTLDQMTQGKIFEYSHIERDHKKLLEITHKVKNWLLDCRKLCKEEIENMFRMIRIDEYSKLEASYDKFKEYSDQIAKQRKQYKIDIFPMLQDTAYSLYLTRKWCVTSSLVKNEEFQNAIINSGIPQLQIGYRSNIKEIQIEAYVTELLSEKQKRVADKNKKAQGVHVVLESINFSELYFNEYFSVVQNAILNYNNQRRKQLTAEGSEEEYEELKITSMTASSYHSLIMFLYACDMPINEINQRLWQIQKLIRPNPILQKNFLTEDDWNQISKSNALKMKEIQQVAWDARIDIYQQVQKMMQTTYVNPEGHLIGESLQNLKYQAHQSADYITSAIETSLNYVVDELVSLDTQQITKENIQEVCQHMAINLDDHYNEDIAKKAGVEKVYLMKMFSSRYLDLIKFLFFSSTFAKQSVLMNIINKNYQKEAWKALISSGILTAFGIKRYVCDILKTLGLSPYASLSEFYEFSVKKIQLNFTAMETRKQKIQFYNYKTRPNMPVWAAILATCSLGEFFRPLADRVQWRFKPTKDQNLRLIKEYFEPKSKEENYLSSAEVITKMPLQLITNEKLKSKITNKTNEIYLGFNFTEIDLKPINVAFVPKVKTRAMSLWNIYREGDHLKYISTLFELPGLTSLSNRLNTYSNSHDNLITSLYKKQLAKLPIRVQTLDFDKILEGDHISPDIQDAIQQSQYVIKQKIKNSGAIDKINYVMYFEIENGSKPLQFVFRHLSAYNPTQSLYQMYKLSYQIEGNHVDCYHELDGQKLTILMQKSPFLNLKFQFASIINKEHRRKVRYHKLNLKNLVELQQETDEKFNFVYMIKFDEFYEEVHDQHPDASSLKAKTEIPVTINYKSFLMEDSIPKFKLVCNKCNNSDEWDTIKLQELQNIMKMTDQEKKDKKIFCAAPNCPSSLGNYKKEKDMYIKFQYRCQNCHAYYCANCKYQIFIDEHQHLSCSRGHYLVKNYPHEIHIKEKIKLPQCSVCQGFHSNYFMYDRDCLVFVCESCAILKLFKEKSL